MSRLMHTWNAAWFGPVSNVRVWLMTRVTALMLALDAWLLMIERGGRYGAGDFNVAHFAWLDAIQPVPTAGLYVGLILSCGVLAMMVALGVLGRLGVVALTVAYSYGWSMSQLDSYQHHVFISWVLLCLCCVPALGTREILEAPEKICAWGYRLLATVTAVLYTFTGISKAEPEWLSGSVLKRINSADGVLEPFRTLFADLGIEEATFWTLSGHSVVAVQWIIAAMWLSILVWGEGGGRWVRVGRFIGVATAVAFHIGAEIVGLRIGWFSGYMLAMTLVTFCPITWLEAVARGAARTLRGPLQAVDELAHRGRSLGWVALSGLSAATIAIVGHELDLPGTQTASLVWAGLAVWATAGHLRRRLPIRYCAFAVALTAATLTMTIELGRARYDFYRFVGGDATRRRQLDDALIAYGRANTYAPKDEGRWKKVETVKTLLRSSNASIK
jgi:hypothetical protein